MPIAAAVDRLASDGDAGRPRWRLRWFSTAAVLLLAAFACALALQPGGSRVVLVIDDLTQLGAACAAVLATGWAARRHDGRERAAWASVSVGLGAWTAGQALWTFYELIADRHTPFPSWADAGYLLFPVGAAAGLWLLPTISGSARQRWLLDGGIIVSALVAVSWATTLGAVAHAPSDSHFGFAVSVAYPIGDILVLSMAILAVCRPHAHRRQLVLLSLAMTAMAVADSVFAYLNATGRYATGSLSDVGWVAAFLLLTIAGSHAATRTVPANVPLVEPDQPAAATLLPYLPLLCAAGVIVVRQVQGIGVDIVEFLSMSVAFTLVLARQYLTVRENRGLLQVVAAREDELHQQAFRDPLTGLANRALFINRAEHALDLHRRDLRAVSVLFCDLDDFKAVNDTLGHAGGDELLVRVAERLRGALRPGDTLARLGGDEFAVLLEDDAQPAIVGARLVQALYDPFALRGGTVTVRTTVGLTQLLPDEQTPTVDVLLAHADIAMYAAKRAGKGQLAAYDATMTSANADDLTLRQSLIEAVTGHRIALAYQPIVDMHTGAIVGVEALARWTHDGIAIPPDRFIPIAHRAGVLGELTGHVLEQACRQLAVWSTRSGRPDLHVAVNIPPSAIIDRTTPARITDLLRRHRLQPAQLVLEVTEEALLENLPVGREVSRQLRDIGVQMSLDDFGTGYSSLLHLKTIHLNGLKIDRGFITNIDTDPTAEHLLDGILSLARHLGLTVIAEGVERPTQAATLRRLHCQFAQGYLYSPAIDTEGISRLLAGPAHALLPSAESVNLPTEQLQEGVAVGTWPSGESAGNSGGR